MSLPSGYTRLEYIKSSGTQYINTGFNPNQNTRVVMDVTPVDVILGKMWCAFGVRQNGIYFGLYKASTGNMNLTWFYGSNYSNYFTVDYAKRHNLEVNKNVASVDGTSKSYAAQTFQFTIPLFLLCDNAAGSPTSAGAALLYSCQIYDNGTLIRDFIPCKNASGAIGLWDDVNSVFYQNAGSGTFDAGELPKAHKVCINGTGHSATKATMLIDGTERKAKKGRVLIDGTGYDLKFAAGIPLSDLSPETILTINEKGTPVQFYVSKHDYESGLNGAGRTLVVRKDCYTTCRFATGEEYSDGELDLLLNNEYLATLNAAVKAMLSTTKFYYTPGSDNGFTQNVTTLQRSVFQLSLTELGKSDSNARIEGNALPIASTLQIAHLNGVATAQWTRTTDYLSYSFGVYYLSDTGTVKSNGNAAQRWGARPSFTLPEDAEVQSNGDGTYRLAE